MKFLYIIIGFAAILVSSYFITAWFVFTIPAYFGLPIPTWDNATGVWLIQCWIGLLIQGYKG